jgi:hypothetical protein
MSMTKLEELMKTRDAKEALAREVYEAALDAYIAERDRAWAEYVDKRKALAEAEEVPAKSSDQS